MRILFSNCRRLLNTGFFEDLALHFLDSIWARLMRICSIKSGVHASSCRPFPTDEGNLESLSSPNSHLRSRYGSVIVFCFSDFLWVILNGSRVRARTVFRNRSGSG